MPYRTLPFKALELARGQGYLSDLETCGLYSLAATLPTDSIVINIGAGMGTSALCFAEAAPGLKIITIDIQDSHPGGGLLAERQTFDNLSMKRPYQVLGDSGKIPWKEDLAPFCVFVDGDHAMAGIEADLDAWLPRILPQGYIAFHDYTRPEWPDVKVAVDKRIEAGEILPVILCDTLLVCRVCGE